MEKELSKKNHVKNQLLHFGVLGGMGPASTNLFLEKVTTFFSSRLNARENYDFPKITMVTLPDSDHISGNSDNHLFLPLNKAMDIFQISGVKFIVSPCNSMHHYFKDNDENHPIPVLKIFSAVDVLYGSKLKNKKVLLLSTLITQRSNVYASLVQNHNVSFQYLGEDDQALLNKLIIDINGGMHIDKYLPVMDSIISKYPVDAVLLACTELSLFNYTHNSIQVFDTLEALSEATFLVASGQHELAEYKNQVVLEKLV